MEVEQCDNNMASHLYEFVWKVNSVSCETSIMYIESEFQNGCYN